MRTLIQQVQHRLTSFIEQRDDVALFVRCSQPENAHLVKILEAIDNSDTPDFFWQFAQPFEQATTYVDALLAQFMEQHDRVRELMEEEEMDPWSEIPTSVRNERLAPPERLRAAMTFSRTLLPSLEGHLAVWVFAPTSIKDPRGYANLMAALLHDPSPQPWYHHLRMIVRDEKGRPTLKGLASRLPHVQEMELDFSPAAIEKSFEDEVNDEQAPMELRMQSLVVLAGMDYSHRRYDLSLQKYKLAQRYYRATGNQTLEALTVNGMGEVYLRKGNVAEAQRHFESALTPAMAADAPPVLQNVLLNLANLKLGQGAWQEAESYYDSAEQLATAQLNGTLKIQCIENKGVCQRQQARYGDAVVTWNEAADLARALEETELLKSILQRLANLYQEGKMRREEQEVAQELARLAA